MALTLSVTFGHFISGTSFGFASPASQELQSPNSTDIFGNNITLTLNQVSWITSAWSVGLAIGSLIAGYLIEYFGRKKTAYFGIGLSFIIGNVIIILSINLGMLIVGRIIVGFGCGLQNSTWMIYLLECTQIEFRSRVICYVIIWELFGTAFIFGLSIILKWIYLALVGAVCALLYMILIKWFTVESPIWLYKQGKLHECRNAFEWLLDKEIIDMTYLTEEVITPFLKEDESSLSYKDVINNWKSITNSMILCLSFVTIGSFQISAYPSTILSLFYVDKAYVKNISFVLPFGSLLGTIIAIRVTPVFNRKPILILSSLGMTLCLGILASL